MRLSLSDVRKSSFLFLPLFVVVLTLLFGCGEKEDTLGVPRFEVERTVRVGYVIDGDTIDTEDGERIRFLGMDTPEIWKFEGDAPDEPWGRDAANFVHLYLPVGTELGLAFEPDNPKDMYGRTLAYLIVDGELLNAILLQEGYADYQDYGTELRYAEYLKRMESQARVYGKGIWEGQGRLPTPKYYIASKHGTHYHDPDSDLAPRISPRNLVRLTEEWAQRFGLEPGRSVRAATE